MTIAALAAWIVNYQVLAALVLLSVFAAGLLVRQPAHQPARWAALDWAALVGLLALAVLCGLPAWPRVALFDERAGAERAPPVVAPQPATAILHSIEIAAAFASVIEPLASG